MNGYLSTEASLFPFEQGDAEMHKRDVTSYSPYWDAYRVHMRGCHPQPADDFMSCSSTRTVSQAARATDRLTPTRDW